MAQFWNFAYNCFTFGEVDLVPTLEEYTTLLRSPKAQVRKAYAKALRHVDEAVTDLFDRLEKGVTPVPAILAETFRSLSMCWRTGEGQFIGYAQLLMEKKFQEAQARNEALERSLSESKNEKDELRARVVELERSLYLYRNRNFVTELKASLSKIEEMKGKIEELEMALQSCEMRIGFLEANEEQWKGQLHHSQDQVKIRDYIMGEVVTQIREVADYL
ncbi:hypothetical protein PVK06_017671 [Gossypium arboreum]|uniref:DUF7745 domain-containing protein n=1 Tax=Gossypium arboreum TaxID=29729 RepID=A0ABR0Q429_GOSAR|nr:hypothetical protein PVK06_017671 [Gossypium arboreum]